MIDRRRVVLAMANLSLAVLPAATLARVGASEPVQFADLAGWAEDDHAAALAAFVRSCRHQNADSATLRPGSAPRPPGWSGICAAAPNVPQDSAAARSFFETHFRPYRISAEDGRALLTGYFEPEFPGALAASAEFPVPVLARPSDLVSVPGEGVQPGWPEGHAAARRGPLGFEPYPDRAAIWAGALRGQGLERAHLRDLVDLFVMQVQGSGRLRLADGSVLRLVYAGRNGHAYTSIGRLLVERGAIPLAKMSLDALTGWLRANPAEARAVMEANRSYIFFEIDGSLGVDAGPIGGEGVSLTAGRSLAVDRALWPYGVPIFVEANVPKPDGAPWPIARLMVAQDTGSAIIGRVRADFFVGTGVEAGRQAGLFRHPFAMTVLWPVDAPPP